LVLLMDVLTSVLSYYMKWSYFIAEYASDRYNIPLSCSNLTVPHLAEYFAHRGGKGNLRRVLTPETCAKMSKAMMGKKHSTKTCAKISKAKTGKKHTDKTRAKMRKTRTDKKHTLKTRAKTRKAQTGTKLTDETRAKMSKAKTGKKHTLETLAKMSKAMAGKKHTLESHVKMSMEDEQKVSPHVLGEDTLHFWRKDVSITY
jgi:hypothetical protein